MFDQRRFLDLVRFFVVFEIQGDQVAEKMAAYHQFHAVDVALRRTPQQAESREPLRELLAVPSASVIFTTILGARQKRPTCARSK